MKNILFTLMIVFISMAVYAQQQVPVDSVSFHIGKQVKVCTKVFGVKQTEKITFINLGAPYPNALLTVVIFAKDYPAFSESIVKLYQDKSVCVSGTISEFKGKVQIVVSNPGEIIVE